MFFILRASFKARTFHGLISELLLLRIYCPVVSMRGLASVRSVFIYFTSPDSELAFYHIWQEYFYFAFVTMIFTRERYCLVVSLLAFFITRCYKIKYRLSPNKRSNSNLVRIICRLQFWEKDTGVSPAVKFVAEEIMVFIAVNTHAEGIIFIEFYQKRSVTTSS